MKTTTTDVKIDYIEKQLKWVCEELDRKLKTDVVSRTEFIAAQEIQNTKIDKEIALINTKIDSLQKTIYIVVGILMVVEIVIRFIKVGG